MAMNWYKLSQQNVQQEYANLLQDKWSGIQITGSGVNETLNIGGISVSAKELLDHVKTKLLNILISNGVKTIDTSPIGPSNAFGLAKSHEVGVVHVDLKKIFNVAKNAIPKELQPDQTSPDSLNKIVDTISSYIEASIAEVGSHEARHVSDFGQAVQQGKPFTSVQEAPAEQFGEQTRKKLYPSSEIKM